jgi:hypothetical protein
MEQSFPQLTGELLRTVAAQVPTVLATVATHTTAAQ